MTTTWLLVWHILKVQLTHSLHWNTLTLLCSLAGSAGQDPPPAVACTHPRLTQSPLGPCHVIIYFVYLSHSRPHPLLFFTQVVILGWFTHPPHASTTYQPLPCTYHAKSGDLSGSGEIESLSPYTVVTRTELHRST